jgi:hypothetical protein
VVAPGIEPGPLYLQPGTLTTRPQRRRVVVVAAVTVVVVVAVVVILVVAVVVATAVVVVVMVVTVAVAVYTVYCTTQICSVLQSSDITSKFHTVFLILYLQKLFHT